MSERSDVEKVKASWEVIKRQERRAKSQGGVLADVPVSLPALPRAQKLQKRAAQVNFDWSDTGAVLAKLEEEISELREAMATGGEVEIEEEMGDILFSCVNLSRHLGLDAETSLRRASGKFEQRFLAMEESAAAAGNELQDLSSAELEVLWEAAKETGTGPR